MEATEVHMETNFQENLFVKKKLNQTDKLLVGLVYRPPSNKTSEYNDKLCSLISETINKGYSHILIMGDFNYPDIDWENWNTKGDNTNSHEYKFVETIQDNFLYQHTRKPTRRRGTDTPHILDLIVANEETMISILEHVSPHGKSDHCVLNFDFNCYANICTQSKTGKMHNNGNYRDFDQEIKNIKWQDIQYLVKLIT
jgi:endonuclease/exonuclease/phosphatase family metal-dependent hydrolase